MSRSGKIKPLENYGGLPDADVLSRGTAVENGINGNPNFSTPPVAPADLKWTSMPSLPCGAELAVIEGPMNEAKPFTFRLKSYARKLVTG